MGSQPNVELAVDPSPAAVAVQPAVQLAVQPEVQQTDGSSRAWMRDASLWCTVGGLGLLAGGAVASGLGLGLNQELAREYEAGQLDEQDASRFDRLDAYELAANSLLVAGALVTAVGATFWVLSPELQPTPGGVRVGVSGRF